MRVIERLPWWCLLLCILAGCEDAPPVIAPGEPGMLSAASVGPSGAVLEGPLGAGLVVPDGAVAQEMTLEIAEAMGGYPELRGLELRSPIFAYRPHGMNFTEPVMVQLPLPEGDPEEAALVTSSNGEDWVYVPNASVNGVHIEVAVMHFSYFAVVSESSVDVGALGEAQYCGSLGQPCCPLEPQCVEPLGCFPTLCTQPCMVEGCFQPECQTECREKLPNGQVCHSDDACASGYCVDSMCCGSACDGQCEACDLPGHLGSCTPVVGLPRGDRPACEGSLWDPSDNPCAAHCDGLEREACTFAPIGQLCGTECVGWGPKPQTGEVSVCNGEGLCLPSYPFSCSPYLCDEDTGTCAEDCADDDDCADGAVCSDYYQGCVYFTPYGECSDTRYVHIYYSRPGEVTVFDCVPYRCDVMHGGCRAACDSGDDCQDGYICSSERVCRLPGG